MKQLSGKLLLDNESWQFRRAITKLNCIGALSENFLSLTAIKIDVKSFIYFVPEGVEKLIARQHPGFSNPQYAS